MPHVRGTVHGIAAMVTLVVGSVLTNTIREEFAVFERVAVTTTRLLVDVAELPISEEIAAVVVPVGVLMGVWVFAYELQRLSRAG
ncbi:hypothetical protein [Halorubrum sp. 48-1-W]|uniref:hypothetical protein n=1 Tax=Halorubrum sp. 48-1-W TaxID=2249761 RepID=UPI0018E59EA2|nr:hypothetical protein [Halorubrum sp. 48-1-W]